MRDICTSYKVILLICILTLLHLPSQVVAGTTGELLAFPGALGFGAQSIGGRFGTLIEVTTLEEDGPGSLREALEATGARIVVFRTGGTITLTSDLHIKNPFLTIAGQSAPGDGICIRGAGIRISTHDVIIRGLRIRVGSDPVGPDPENRDGIGIEDYTGSSPHNIIIDHCSVSWAIDESIATWYACNDITISNCIIGESLTNGGHPKGEHNYGLLIGDDAKNISVIGNVFAHNAGRNPLGKNGTHSEVINNVIYNWKWEGTHFSGDGDPIRADIIGNTYIGGVNTDNSIRIFDNANLESLIYVYDNPEFVHGGTTDISPWNAVTGNEEEYRSYSRLFSATSPQPSAVAFDFAIESAGAIVPKRDSVDSRIIADVVNKTGSFVGTEDDVGGYPEYAPGQPPEDSDQDGIPNTWEIAHNLNPNLISDGNGLAPSGYTWVEEYLNSLFDKTQIKQLQQIPIAPIYLLLGIR